MLIITRYAGERFVIQSPQGNSLWVDCDEQGLFYCDEAATPIPYCGVSRPDFDGQALLIAHLSSSGRNRINHRIGIEAPKDYKIWREELLK